MNIAIYEDKGAGERSVQLLISALKSETIVPRATIQCIDKHTLKETHWEANTSLLIFPGGRDVYYHEALRGIPNERIKNYVKNGGAYLGLCAGGYYGAAKIEFEKGHKLEILAKRELQFFSGTASGPAYGPNQFRYEDESGSRVAKLSWLGPEEIGPASIYFNGGCTFVDADQHSNTMILARYQDLQGCPAAIIQCQVGKGRAILSGVHPEYCAPHLEALNLTPNHLQITENTRQKIFRSILMRLVVSTCPKDLLN